MLNCSVSGQILPTDMDDLVQAGIKSVVNNRPDGEAPDQPTSAEIAAAAQQAGLEYAYIPFSAGHLTIAQVEQFADFYNRAPKPIHLFCRTGNRSQGLLEQARALDLLDDM